MNSVGKPIASVATRLQIAILAAGFSRRLGQPKALARVHGISLLRRTVAAASRITGSQVIVIVPPQYVRYRTEARGFKVRFAVNAGRAGGLSSSVRRSIARARYSSAVLLLPVDLAVLERRDLEKLVSRWRKAPRRVIARRIAPDGASPQRRAPPDVAINGGASREVAPLEVAPLEVALREAEPQGGVPLILPRWLYARALDITGDKGLRDLVNRLPAEQRVLVDLRSAAFDIDTPEDLQAARRRLRRHTQRVEQQSGPSARP